MTKDEFRKVLRNLMDGLPSFQSWFKKISPKTDQRTTLETWYNDVFFSLDHDDCKSVIQQMTRGELEKPFWGELPSLFRRECGELNYQRRVEEDKSSHYTGAWHSVTQGPLMKDLFHACLKARKQARTDGDDPNAVGSMVVRKLLANMEPDRRDGVSCQRCRDTGWVECWDVKTMQLAFQLPKNERETRKIKWYSCSVACNCSWYSLKKNAYLGCTGPRKWPVRKGKKIEMTDLPVYDSSRWVLVEDGKFALWSFVDNYVPPNISDFGEYGRPVFANRTDDF